MPGDFDDDTTPAELISSRRRMSEEEANAALVEAHREQVTVHPLATLVAPDDIPCRYKHERTELELTQLRLRVGQLEAALVELQRK